MSIPLARLKKIRCRVLDQASGEPVAGIVVSLSIGASDGGNDGGSESCIPVSTLISDATGYIAFDVAPLIELGIDTAQGLFISAPQAGIDNHDLVKGLFASDAQDARRAALLDRVPAPGLAGDLGLPVAFPIYVDRSKTGSAAPCAPAGLPSVQSPDKLDYELSPYSFVKPTKFTVGDDCCEVLAPSTLPVQEHMFYRVIVRHQATRDERQLDGAMTRVVEVDRQLPQTQRVIKFAEVLEYRQRWYGIGHSLGEIRYSLPLAPGESTQLAMIDWTRNDTAGRFDAVLATEFLQHELHRDRSIEESIDAGLHESQSGWSWAGGLSSGMTYDTFLYGKYSGDWAAGGSTSNTRGDRNLDAESLQQLHDAVTQGTSYVRSLNSTVIVQANQAESNVVQTRRVANHNHCHALTIEYYEVLRHFRLRTEFGQRTSAVLIPFSPMTFTRDLALRFRTLLERSLLDEKLADCFDALVRLSVGQDAYEKPTPTSPDGKTTDDDGQYFFGHLPVQFPVVAAVPGGISQTDLNIKKGSILTLAAMSTGIKFGREATAKTFGPEGSDAYGYPPEPTMHAGALLADIGGDRYEVGLGKTFTAKNDGRLRFLFNDPSWNDNDGVAFVDIDVKKPTPAATDTPAVTAPATQAPAAFTERADKVCEQRLPQHLNGNIGYYNRAIWFLMDPAERRLDLEDALGADSALLSAIDDKPLAVSGNHVAFPYNGTLPDIGPDPQTPAQPLDSIVTLPTRGLFAEAQLGHCNACETRDVLRMSDWTQMTVEEPPAISGIQPGPAGQMPTLTPAQLPSNVIQIAPTPAAPDPTGLAAALQVLGTPNVFRDMSGLDQVSALLGKLADGSIKTLEDMIRAAGQAKSTVDAVRAGQKSGTGGAAGGGSAAPSEPDAGKQIDKLNAIDFGRGKGLLTDDAAQRAAEGVVGGRITPVGGDDPLRAGDWQVALVVRQFRDLITFTPPAAIVTAAAARGLTVQQISDGWGQVNLDRYLIRITRLPQLPQSNVDFTEAGFFEHVRRNFATFMKPYPRTGQPESLAPFSSSDGSSWDSSTPLGSVLEFTIDVPMLPDLVAPLVPERGLVPCTEYSSEPGRDHHWNFSTMTGPNPAGYHPVSGTRQFGLRAGNGDWYFYTRSADRMGGAIEWEQSDAVYKGQDEYWKYFQTALTKFVNDHGGQAETPPPEGFVTHIDWDQVQRITWRPATTSA